MAKQKWVKFTYEIANECIMMDFYFDTAPPEQRAHHFALGETETKVLLKELRKFLKDLPSHKRKLRGLP